MLRQFRGFIEERKLFGTSDSILLAVSGGRDSVVMADLFHRAGYEFAIAHCNFNLRGAESDLDEHFSRDLARQYLVPFHSQSFSTIEFSRAEGISVQMAARDLRYRWFEELRRDKGFDWIATAHHRDDEVETFLINILRGTGIRGLSGIPVKRGNVVRPLLFATRKEIDTYIAAQGLKFREDSSNIDEKYLRNSIRHRVIPLLETLNPDFAGSIAGNVERIREFLEVVDSRLEELRRRVASASDEGIRYNRAGLASEGNMKFWTYELLRNYGFSRDATDRLAEMPEGTSGRQFISPTHRLLVEREDLLVQSLTELEQQSRSVSVAVEKDTAFIESPVRMKFEQFDSEGIEISGDRQNAFIDLDRLEFPLELRPWKEGDAFRPLGMKGSKKLSDFFIDNKIEVVQKKKAYVLCSGKDIVWLVGYRLDDRYKITPSTYKVLKVSVL